LQSQAQAQTFVSTPTIATAAPTVTAMPSESPVAAATPEVQKPVNTQEVYFDESHAEVRKEIKRILITLASLLVVIVAVYFINQKTNIILETGQFLLNKLNINL